MSVASDDEREQLQTNVRRFLSEVHPREEVRHQMESDEGFDRSVWQRMAHELGLQGLGIPEEFGGGGYSAQELGVVFYEMGRALYGGPFWSTVGAAVPLILNVANEATKKAWLPRIADGTMVVATPALTAVTDETHAPVVASKERLTDGGWRLAGQMPATVDAEVADILLVAAQTAQGTGVFAVHGGDPRVTPVEGLDLTRRFGRVTFDDTPAEALSLDADLALARATDSATVMLAAEQAGGAMGCLEMSVQYARVREQFGHPIGSFQAIQHLCADMLLDAESATAVAATAAAAAAEEASVMAAVAGAWCGEAYATLAGKNIQIHGGIGFTWEHDAHLHYRRANASRIQIRTPREHRRRLAALVGL